MDTYRATNTKNGKFYIGSTGNFEKRKKEHLNSKENYPFQNALRKNPADFEWKVWFDDFDEPVLEQALLDMWFGKEQCYNLNPHATRPSLEMSRKSGKQAVENGTGIFSPEWKSSEAYREHQAKAGSRGGSALVERRIGIMDPDYIESQEYKDIRRRNGSRLALEKRGMFSEEVQISAREKRLRAVSNPVVMVSPEGEQLTFPSIREASRSTNIGRVAIKNLILGNPSRWALRGWKAHYAE